MDRRSTTEPSAHAGGSPVSGAGTAGPALIGLAHGSRHAEGTRSVEQLMALVGATGDLDARPAFLDLAQPDLTTTAAALVGTGHLAIPLEAFGKDGAGLLLSMTSDELLTAVRQVTLVK